MRIGATIVVLEAGQPKRPFRLSETSVASVDRIRGMDEEKQGILGTAQSAISDASKTVIETTSNVATGAVKAVRKRTSGRRTKKATSRNAKKKAVAKKAKKMKKTAPKKSKKAKAKKPKAKKRK